ncbi:SDR family oxidoreductase [Streptomyces sp. NPDC052415]|uniref:SDR family oxidoreductase n=1 Tax=Streptomyces sp. NPDC052415 TaxID=3365690 RepID=UPI0037D1CCA3
MRSSPLAGRTVAITGAARGLGAALAREVAGRGARVALLGHEKGALEAVAASLPGPALAVEVDVTDLDALTAAADEVRARLGRPSAVVANAGIAEGGPFLASDPAAWRRVIDVNVTGSAHTARAFLPDLFGTAGYFLQIASLASIGAVPMMSAYCASKAGAEAFAHALRAEVAHRGVAVGIGYLSWTDTDMIRDADRYPVMRELRAHLPPPARRTHPAEPAAARLAKAMERRRTAVYAPAWLRAVQPVRPLLPPVVARLSRRELSRSRGGELLGYTGPLGAGGAADRTAHEQRP